jgi:hypothetical protein
MKDNHEHSGDIHTAPELSTRSSRARGRQPDKDEVDGASPPLTYSGHSLRSTDRMLGPVSTLMLGSRRS